MNKSAVLGTGPVLKLFVKLALPAVLAQIVNLMYNIVDRMYVGRIAGIGTDALAGLGICFPILIIVSAFGVFIGTGGAPLAAIKFGEKNNEGAERILNNGFTMLIIFSVVITALLLIFSKPILYLFGMPDSAMQYGDDYLKIYAAGTVFVLISVGLNSFITTQGFAKTAMFTVLIGAVLNIALDPLFIFVFHMGVKGAALATIIAQAVSAIWVVLFFLGKQTEMKLRPKLFKLRKSVLLPILALGLSPFVMEVTDSAAQIVFNVQLRYLTGNNTDYTAAMSILLSVMQIIALPLNGMGTGAQPLISYNYGAGNFKRVKLAVTHLLWVSAVFTSISWILCISAPSIFAVIFHASPSVTQIVEHALPKFMMGSILFVFQWSLQNSFLALGQAKVSMFLTILRKLFLLVPLTLVLPLFMGVNGVFWAEGIGDLVASVTTLVVFSLSFRKIMDHRRREISMMRLPDYKSEALIAEQKNIEKK